MFFTLCSLISVVGQKQTLTSQVPHYTDQRKHKETHGSTAWKTDTNCGRSLSKEHRKHCGLPPALVVALQKNAQKGRAAQLIWRDWENMNRPMKDPMVRASRGFRSGDSFNLASFLSPWWRMTTVTLGWFVEWLWSRPLDFTLQRVSLIEHRQ